MRQCSGASVRRADGDEIAANGHSGAKMAPRSIVERNPVTKQIILRVEVAAVGYPMPAKNADRPPPAPLAAYAIGSSCPPVEQVSSPSIPLIACAGNGVAVRG